MMHDGIMPPYRRRVLDEIALRSPGEAAPVDEARYFRPARLPGVEVLHARFVTHCYAAHLHESWTLAAVDSGAATFELDGARHVAPAGSTFLIPPGAVHTGEPATPVGYRYRVVYLDPAGYPAETADLLSARPGRDAPVVVRHQRLAHTLTQLHHALESPEHTLEQGESLNSVAGALAELLSGQHALLRPRSHRAVASAIEYIRAHIDEDFSLGDLARAVGVSRYHLVRVFHADVGMPPSDYRRALRVLAAQYLLQSGHLPVEVAVQCGFYDQSHLNRHFKAVTGVTPRQYARAVS
jgi:AraC-like DNA-binding protein